MQIQISWLLQKPTDLDLRCLQNRVYLGSAGSDYLIQIIALNSSITRVIKVLIALIKVLITLINVIKLHNYPGDNVMTDSADPDQLASSEANWSGSTLFAKEYIRVQQDKG